MASGLESQLKHVLLSYIFKLASQLELLEELQRCQRAVSRLTASRDSVSVSVRCNLSGPAMVPYEVVSDGSSSEFLYESRCFRETR